MAKVILDANETYTVASASTIFGAAGSNETVKVLDGAAVTFGGDVERVEFAGASTAFTYKATTTGVQVLKGTTVVANVVNNQKLAFTDGSATVSVTFDAATASNVVKVGTQTVTATAAAPTFTPNNAAGEASTLTAGSSSTPTTGQSFSLTTGVDNVAGTAGNDEISGVYKVTAAGDASTFNAGDIIKGGAGIDTLSLTIIDDNGAGAVAGVVVSEVENLSIRNLDSSASVDASTFTGVTKVTSNASTQNLAVTGLAAAATVALDTTAKNLDVTFADAAYATAGGTLNVAVKGAGDALTKTDSTITVKTASADGKVTKLAVEATGTNYLKLASGAAGVAQNAGVTTLTVTGSGTLDLDNASTLDNGGSTLTADLTKVDASGNTGGLTIKLSNKDVAVTGGSGADVVTLSNSTALTDKAGINLGAGADKLLNSSSAGVGTSAVLDGGDGKDTIASTLLQVGNQANIKNWEILDVAGENRTIDASLFKSSSFESVAISANLGGATVLQKLAGTAINVDVAATTTAALTAELATNSGTSDTANINFDAKGAGYTVNAFTSTGLETVTINSNGDETGANVVTALNDKQNTLTTVTIKGANDFTLSDIDTNATAVAAATTNPSANVVSALTLIDGSAATGDLDISAGTRTQFTDTTTGTFYFTYDKLVIKGGAGNDTLTHNALGGGEVYGGAGDDTITVQGKGAKVDTGAAGSATGDSVTVSAANVAVTLGDGKQTVATDGDAAAGTALTQKTTITGAAKGDVLDLSGALKSATTDAITDANSTIAAAASLTEALNLAIGAGAGTDDGDLVFFQWDGKTYIVADNDGDTNTVLHSADSVVELVGTYTNFSVTNGVVTFA